MAFHASRVQLSYDFTRTIPTDNPKYKEYQEFRKRFGDDGNLLFVGGTDGQAFQAEVFADYIALTEQLKKVPGVDDVLGFSSAVNLIRDSATQKFKTLPIFSPPYTQARIDSGKAVLLGLPFYRGLLYNPETNTWLTMVKVNKDVMNSKKRIETVGAITTEIDSFGSRHGFADALQRAAADPYPNGGKGGERDDLVPAGIGAYPVALSFFFSSVASARC